MYNVKIFWCKLVIAWIRIKYKLLVAWLCIKYWFIFRRTDLKIFWMKYQDKLRRIIKWFYINFAPRSTCIRMGEWVNYKSGFSGTGPSLLDKKPEIVPSRFQKWLVADEIGHQKAIRYAAWRMACIETLGEDPEEW